MAAVTPINPQSGGTTPALIAYGFTTPAGPIDGVVAASGAACHLECCMVACNFSGTYVQNTGFSITSAQLIAAIQADKRDGSTITIWDVASEAPGIEVSSIVTPGPVTFTTSAGPATGLLYGQDFSTPVEHAAAVMGVFASPVVFGVTFVSVGAP